MESKDAAEIEQLKQTISPEKRSLKVQASVSPDVGLVKNENTSTKLLKLTESQRSQVLSSNQTESLVVLKTKIPDLNEPTRVGTKSKQSQIRLSKDFQARSTNGATPSLWPALQHRSIVFRQLAPPSIQRVKTPTESKGLLRTGTKRICVFETLEATRRLPIHTAAAGEHVETGTIYRLSHKSLVPAAFAVDEKLQLDLAHLQTPEQDPLEESFSRGPLD